MALVLVLVLPALTQKFGLRDPRHAIARGDDGCANENGTSAYRSFNFL